MTKHRIPPTTTSEAAPVFSTARFTVDLPTLLAPHDMIWQEPLPSDWRRGAPLGNGDFGVVLSGCPRDFSLVVSKTDIWDRRNDDQSCHPGADFQAVRKTYIDGDAAAFKRLQDEMAARPAQARERPHLTTCGTLRLHVDEGINAIDLRMSVVLAEGVARMTYDDRHITAAVSSAYDVLVVEIDRGVGTPSPDPFVETYDKRLPSPELPWEFTRPPLDVNPRVEFKADEGLYLATQRFAAGGSYTVGIAFAGGRADEHVTLAGRLAGRVSGFTGRRCQLYLTVVSSADAADPEAECRRRLQRALAAGAEAILDAHRAWWKDYWMRGLASVGDRRVEKWYYRSLYLCGSMLRPGRQSPGLQGVWCGENYPWWSADYHSNINIQAVYWGLFTNNRMDMVEPYLRLYSGFADHARDVARRYYRLRGLKFPHAATIGGHELTTASYSRLSLDPCESAWVAQVFWTYYRYSGDERMLRDVAYPILRDVALFLADYLVWDPAQRAWTMPPVPHFEQDCLLMSGWDDNTLYAQALFRLGLRQAIAAAEVLGVDEEHRKEWREKLNGLVEPPTTPEGAWKPFAHRDPSFGGHNFLLPIVFPAEEVSAVHGPDRWREQARLTWQKFKGRTGSGGAWCGGQGIAEILRIGEVEAAFAEARWPENFSTNGFVINPALMQADHGPGMCRVLSDFVVLEMGGVIHLFYGIPRQVPARFFSLRAPGGFLLTAEKRGEVPDYVLVHPTAATALQLANPWREAIVTDLQNGASIARTSEKVVSVELGLGRDYLVAPAGFSLEACPIVDFACPETGSI